MAATSRVATRVFSVVALALSPILIVMAQNPVPFINQPLVPDAIAPGVPGVTFTLTVNGTGFVPRIDRKLERQPANHGFCEQLAAHCLHSVLRHRPPSTASITVVSPEPGGGTSNAVFLPINDPSSTLSFGRPVYYVGGSPQLIATADFNRDASWI